MKTAAIYARVSTEEPRKFYVYILLRPDGRPFYVGKGHGRRIEMHEYHARRGERSHKAHIIRQVETGGGSIHKLKVAQNLTERDAFTLERQVIAYFGQRTLTNLTTGGDGVAGLKSSAAVNAKRSAALKGRPAHNRGKKVAEETKAKIATKLRGITRSPEARGRMSAAQKGRAVSDQTRAKLSAALKGRVSTFKGKRHSAEARAAIGAAGKGRTPWNKGGDLG